jgi:hypothetical protein
VASSLTRGLQQLGTEFGLNPRRLQGAETLGVLSGLDALAEGLELRRRGEVGRLIAGPNLVVLPSDAAELMSAPEIDWCVVPSQWVKELYERDLPDLAGRVAIWPAGVDAAYWSPGRERERGRPRALVFRKFAPGQTNAPEAEVQEACAHLRANGFATTTLSYGRFDRRTYRRALRASDLAVYFGTSESQGIALVEAWSAGVPTLVRRCESLSYRNRSFPCSAAPYLTGSTGALFSDAAELGSLLESWGELSAGFDPRGWVLGNMTDEISARSYLALALEPSRHASRSASVSGP